MDAVEAHSLLVHHLKCIGLTETADRYRALQDTEPKMLKMQNVIILRYFYVFYSLHYREFLTENPISVSQWHKNIFVVMYFIMQGEYVMLML